MGWSHIPDVDSALSSSEDNPFAAPKQQPTGKISVNLPTDDWLCRKMDRLNVTLTHGYPSKGSEAGGLQRDHYVHPLGGGHIIFALSAVWHPTWFPDILGNSSYPIFTKFGMQVYWVSSLYGIAFGDDSSIAD